MLERILTLSDEALAAETPEAASAAFYAAIQREGASYLQTRLYRRPVVPLTSATHWAAGGFVARFSRPGWVGSDAFNYVCFQCNPLLDAIRTGRTRYRFSDFAPHDRHEFGAYWEALSEAGIGDALCATGYGPGRRIASLHIGFDRRAFEPDLAVSIQAAGMILAEKLMTFETPGAADPPEPKLTARERDALGFVAEGKTDWEIATILGVSEATARFHVDNARRKLDAVNRAHAVARFLALEGPF